MWLASVIVLPAIALWEILVRVFRVPVYLLPSPSHIFITLIENLEFYFEASALTLIEALSGLFLGLFAGVFGATLLGLWPRMERGVMTLAILVKSTPLIAIAPLLTIWLGFGIMPKIIITGLLTFLWPVRLERYSWPPTSQHRSMFQKLS